MGSSLISPKKSKIVFITYSCDTEVLITIPKHEHEFLRVFFPHNDHTPHDDEDRDIDNYHREEIYSVSVEVRPRLLVDF